MPPVPTSSDAGASANSKRPNLLLMDDDPGIRKALGARLESAGYAVRTAKCGADTISSFKKHGADLVILDVNVPDADGFEICQAIKKIQDVPVVFLTGEQGPIFQDHMAQMVKAAGGEFFLGKPFDSNLLLRLIGEALQS